MPRKYSPVPGSLQTSRPAQPRTVLIAVTGLSPAVLTETIWALAKHPSHPVIPDIVVVLTTLTGEMKIKEQLFGVNGLWLSLRQELLGKHHAEDARLDFSETPDRLKVFTRRSAGKRIQLDRMDSLEETEAVGDCLVEEIWNWVGRPDTRVLASISGGFKTMSALMYAAMSLLGGSRDRILHVLVEDPFDGGTRPLYFWPGQPEQKLSTTRLSKSGPIGTELRASDMKPVLTDVRFPALRKLFNDYGFKNAPTFTELVEKCRESVDAIAPSPIEICELRRSTREINVNGERIKVSPTQFYILLFLAECVRDNQEFDNVQDINVAFLEFLVHQRSISPVPRHAFLDDRIKVVRAEVKGSSDPRFTKNLSELRKSLAKRPESFCIALAKALPSGKNRLLLTLEQLRFLD